MNLFHFIRKISRFGLLIIESILSGVKAFQLEETTGRFHTTKCLTSRTIRQSKLHLRLQGVERALSEHQWAFLFFSGLNIAL